MRARNAVIIRTKHPPFAFFAERTLGGIAESSPAPHVSRRLRGGCSVYRFRCMSTPGTAYESGTCSHR